jgi:hypothetical protein
MSLIILFLYTALFTWIFWAGYVLVMGIYRAYLTKRLSRISLILGFPFIIAGYLMDVGANLIIAPFIFLDLPQEMLVTTRLQRYIKNGTGWRVTVASFICENLLDIFDPSGDHC